MATRNSEIAAIVAAFLSSSFRRIMRQQETTLIVAIINFYWNFNINFKLTVNE